MAQAVPTETAAVMVEWTLWMPVETVGGVRNGATSLKTQATKAKSAIARLTCRKVAPTQARSGPPVPGLKFLGWRRWRAERRDAGVGIGVCVALAGGVYKICVDADGSTTTRGWEDSGLSVFVQTSAPRALRTAHLAGSWARGPLGGHNTGRWARDTTVAVVEPQSCCQTKILQGYENLRSTNA